MHTKLICRRLQSASLLPLNAPWVARRTHRSSPVMSSILVSSTVTVSSPVWPGQWVYCSFFHTLSPPCFQWLMILAAQLWSNFLWVAFHPFGHSVSYSCILSLGDSACTQAHFLSELARLLVGRVTVRSLSITYTSWKKSFRERE